MRIRLLLVAAMPVWMTGCMNGGQTAAKPESHPEIRIVRSPSEGGPGPLTGENASIGGIHIGDSRDAVSNILGEPSEIREGGGGTPFVQWYYEQHNVYVSFYRASETGPVGGVAAIAVSSPSTLKTDKHIGTGDSLASVAAAYDSVLGTGELDGIVNLWINGARAVEGFFVPQLHFVLHDGRITWFELTTNLTDPDKWSAP